eukprot:SAG11_NODE_1227_length_5474_cov_5.294326_4_plen_42_part_00
MHSKSWVGTSQTLVFSRLMTLSVLEKDLASVAAQCDKTLKL